VVYLTRSDRVIEDVARLDPSALCFDFDHPDQQRLQTLQDVKRYFVRLPVLMLTLDHSESLAVWAFRSRVWNYLVKPVSAAEFSENLAAVAQIAHPGSQPRIAHLLDVHLPPDLVAAPADPRVTRLQPALNYVREYCHDRISETDAAALCGLTRFAFSRNFHSALGLTFREYVMRARITEARRMLVEGGHSVTDVAFATGFNDGSYFARMFRRHTGVLPSDVRPGSQRATTPAETALRRGAADRRTVDRRPLAAATWR
jgi:AraC-like DNA-binding protein